MNVSAARGFGFSFTKVTWIAIALIAARRARPEWMGATRSRFFCCRFGVKTDGTVGWEQNRGSARFTGSACLFRSNFLLFAFVGSCSVCIRGGWWINWTIVVALTVFCGTAVCILWDRGVDSPWSNTILRHFIALGLIYHKAPSRDVFRILCLIAVNDGFFAHFQTFTAVNSPYSDRCVNVKFSRIIIGKNVLWRAPSHDAIFSEIRCPKFRVLFEVVPKVVNILCRFCGQPTLNRVFRIWLFCYIVWFEFFFLICFFLLPYVCSRVFFALHTLEIHSLFATFYSATPWLHRQKDGRGVIFYLFAVLKPGLFLLEKPCEHGFFGFIFWTARTSEHEVFGWSYAY